MKNRDMVVYLIMVIALEVWGQSIWNANSPVPTRLSLFSVTYGSGIFIAVGDSGIMATSSDGLNWQKRFWLSLDDTITLQSDTSQLWAKYSSFPRCQLNSVMYANNKFVAVGKGANIITSSDGAKWKAGLCSGPGSNPNLFPPGDLYSVSYGDSMFVVACAGSGAYATQSEILASYDGVTWGILWCPYLFRCLAFGNGRFVGVGSFVIGYCFSSSNLIHGVWNQSTFSPSSSMQGVVYGDVSFVAVGNNGIITSADAINWVTQDSSTSAKQSLNSVTYGSGRFVAVGGSKIVGSSDGISWVTKNSGAYYLFCVTYGNGKFVAVGANGAILTSNVDVVGVNRHPESYIRKMQPSKAIGIGSVSINGRCRPNAHIQPVYSREKSILYLK
jgi:hypothetical protein